MDSSQKGCLSGITGKDSQITFDDVHSDFSFTLFFMLLKIFVLFCIKNLHGPAKKKEKKNQLQLYYQQS